jgi:hypothetical protein
MIFSPSMAGSAQRQNSMLRMRMRQARHAMSGGLIARQAALLLQSPEFAIDFAPVQK